MFSHILIGVTGSIAAYKIPDLVRAWKATGASVRVVLTACGEQFISPLCLEALSESHVYRSQDHLDASFKMSHIELARWADQVLIAPASAHFIAQLAHGLCHDLLSTLCLVHSKPLWVAPAMNRSMWEAAATQANVQQLLDRGTHFLGPDTGLQACGDMGQGRLLDVDAIVSAMLVHNRLAIWAGKKIVITGGPTREAIDPVRYISNRSTGHMAYALARCAYALGGQVILITGPTHLPIPIGVQAIHVETSEEMLAACLKHAPGTDLFIGAAAVTDDQPVHFSPQKMKKSGLEWSLSLKPTPDIIATVAQLPERPQWVVGFAAETENLQAHARYKLKHKHLDAIVGNLVGCQSGFGDVLHEACLISEHEATIYFPKTDKNNLAQAILQALEKLMNSCTHKTVTP